MKASMDLQGTETGVTTNIHNLQKPLFYSGFLLYILTIYIIYAIIYIVNRTLYRGVTCPSHTRFATFSSSHSSRLAQDTRSNTRVSPQVFALVKITVCCPATQPDSSSPSSPRSPSERRFCSSPHSTSARSKEYVHG